MGYSNFSSPKIFAKIVYLNLGIRENSDKTFVAPMETASFFGDRAEAKSPKKIEWTAGEALKRKPNLGCSQKKAISSRKWLCIFYFF